MPTNQLVDSDAVYCSPDDVERYIRNKDFSATSDPTLSQVKDMIADATSSVEDETRRYWRTRKTADRILDVEFHHTSESSLERRRRRSSRHGFLNPIDEWGKAFLPHMHLQEIDNAQGDKVEVFLQDGVQDITTDGGTRSEDSKWYLDTRKGVLYVDVSEFLVGPVRGSGKAVNPRVRLTYRIGQTSALDGDNVPEEIPRAVRMATAKLVAADLIDTDQYGAMLSSGPENTPDQSTAAQRLREDAWDELTEYRVSKVMI